VTIPLRAQEIQVLSMDELLETVLENNQGLKIAQQDIEVARGDFRQSNSLFLPNIKASHTGFTTTNPLNAFGSKLNQEILTEADFNPALLNDPERTDNFATRFEFEQPLINLDGIYQRKAARNQLDASQLQYSRKEDYLRLEVKKAYMQVQLAQKAVSVLEQSRETVAENLRLTENYFGQGLLQKADLLMARVRLNEVENELQKAKSNRQNASDYLSVLMNKPLGKTYRTADSLGLMQKVVDKTALPEERADLKAMELAVDAYNNSFKADKFSFFPRLNAFGSYQLFDDQLFKADANGYLIGAQLSWDILNGARRFGKAHKSKAAYERSKIAYEKYLSESQLELQRALRLLEDARKAVYLNELALEQSRESYRIRKNRFTEGLEKVSDLLMAETQQSTKELQYAQAVFEHNYTLAYLEFLTAN
jgi:outer membrane protein TolC